MSKPVLIIGGKDTDSNLGFSLNDAVRNMSRIQHRKSETGTIQEVLTKEAKGLDVRFFSEGIDITEPT